MNQVINLQKYLNYTTLKHVPELVSKIILTWQSNGAVELATREGQSFQECGLYDLLDSVCSTANIPKDQITLVNNNWTESHPEYIVKQAPFSYEIMHFHQPNPVIPGYTGEKFYGMFIGRATLSRTRALFLSKQRFIPSLTSFNHDFNTFSQIELGYELLTKKHCTVEEWNSLRPYSDVGDPTPPPIVPPQNSFGQIWNIAYSKIALEIVLETTDWPGSFHLTEKTCRPIYYKRPFIMVGARGFMQKLREMGFRTFENLIPNHYEKFDHCVDQAFECLDLTYQRYGTYGTRPDNLLDVCQGDVEHNYNRLIELATEHKLSQDVIGSQWWNDDGQ